MKFVIISPVLPPKLSGQAIVIYRLLKNRSPKDYFLISSQQIKNQDCTTKLHGRYYLIPQINNKFSNFLIISDKIGLNCLLKIYLKLRIQWFIFILKREKCSCVVGCSADLFDPYCSLIASRNLNIPFIFYSFDDYLEQWINPNFLRFSRKVGPEILKSAKKVIVPNEFLKNYYLDLFSIDSTVIHNPVDLEEYNWSCESIQGRTNEISIVYTGAIYDLHYDAFRSLSNAIEKLSDYKITLNIYSNEGLPEEYIKNSLKFIIHKHQPISSMPRIQKCADILFLPFTFTSSFNDIIVKTASPGKIGEYLASGRPILVLAPHDSFVSWYFKKYNCGLVVDSDNPVDLEIRLKEIITNSDLREIISQNARERAKADFDEKKIQEEFYSVINSYEKRS